MADPDRFGESCTARVVTKIIFGIPNGNDARHARRDLIERDPMRMRMEPVKSRGMVRRYFDRIIGGIEGNHTMNMRTDNRGSIG